MHYNPYYQLILVFILLYNISFAQQTKYKFKIIDNNIVIPYTINNQKFRLIFDTGANFSILDSAKAQKANLKFKGKPHLTSLLIADIMVSDLDYQDKNLGFVIASNQKFEKSNIDGILGASNIMKEKIISIDFRKNELIIVDSIKNVVFNNSDYINVRLFDSNIGTLKKTYTGINPSVFGNIFTTDTLIQSMFIIDTGCRFETLLLISDSTLIKKISKKRLLYTNPYSDKKIVNFTEINYKLDSIQGTFKYSAYIFKQDSGPFSATGYKPIAVLLGLPFYRKYKSIIINWPEKELLLEKN